MDPVVAPAWKQLQGTAAVASKKADAAAFNTANRWRKRGVHCMPVHYSMNTAMFGEAATVTVHEDGSITVDHSGIEVGQGINLSLIHI